MACNTTIYIEFVILNADNERFIIETKLNIPAQFVGVNQTDIIVLHRIVNLILQYFPNNSVYLAEV